MKKFIVSLVAAAILTVFGVVNVLAGPPGPPAPPNGHNLVTICHKPGTPAQKTMDVPDSAVPGHLGHGDTKGPCVPPAVDKIIDADGIATNTDGLPGARDPGLVMGAMLSTFPAPNPLGNGSGLDWFDQDATGSWTLGDDLHEEGTAFCATALRNAVYDLGLDCVVLDPEGSLVNLQFVTGDVEFGGGPANLKYYDANGNGTWDDGEDLVLDVNMNGIFD